VRREEHRYLGRESARIETGLSSTCARGVFTYLPPQLQHDRVRQLISLAGQSPQMEEAANRGE
jgi:hypothetical protein